MPSPGAPPPEPVPIPLTLGDLAGRSPAGLAAIGRFLALATGDEDALARFWMPVVRALDAYGLTPAAGAPELWQRALTTLSETADAFRPVVVAAWHVIFAAGGPPAERREFLAEVGVLPKYRDLDAAIEAMLQITNAPWWTAGDRAALVNRILQHDRLDPAGAGQFLRRLDPQLPGVFAGAVLAASATPARAQAWLDGVGFWTAPLASLANIEALPDPIRSRVADALWSAVGEPLLDIPGGASTALRWASARVRLQMVRALPPR